MVVVESVDEVHPLPLPSLPIPTRLLPSDGPSSECTLGSLKFVLVQPVASVGKVERRRPVASPLGEDELPHEEADEG